MDKDRIHEPGQRYDPRNRDNPYIKERHDGSSTVVFPGQQQKDNQPAYGTYDWHRSNPNATSSMPMPMPMPMSMYPPYYRPPMDPYGAAALTLGIVSMCMFWLSILPYNLGTTIFVFVISIASLGLVFGIFAFVVRRPRSIAGLVGLILTIIAICLACILWAYTHDVISPYYY